MKGWLLAELIGGPAAGMHVWIECPAQPEIAIPVRVESLVPTSALHRDRQQKLDQLVYKRVANCEPGPFVPYYFHETRKA